MIIFRSVLRMRTVSDKNLEMSKDKICVQKFFMNVVPFMR